MLCCHLPLVGAAAQADGGTHYLYLSLRLSNSSLKNSFMHVVSQWIDIEALEQGRA